ncbi:hypothetical protein TRFO_16781 [Tritrichomonas foetus]|uniref:J domain-containing protein n=1 Tax=Tritrichomonas foetus TaxID=1144522 RepID=A0A1J4KPP4_9EUKA|nr:hypothetical protein TRFO_16781 [Tritrichomonas foetus]|eukprot:OHT13211.1 hypothetical protein TRFO_16781 [Tritrichomonas foetus]
MTDEEYPEVEKVLKAETLYEVLCVEKTCTTDQIKRGYKKMAMKVHPDRCKHSKATAAFQRISHAYQVLSDDDKRSHYDRFGENAPDPGQPNFRGDFQQGNFRYYNFNGGGFPGGQYYTFDDEISPEDIFNMFFGINPGFQQRRYHNFGNQDFQRRRRQQQQQQQEEYDNLPFYKRPQFMQLLVYLLPVLLVIFSGIFSSNNEVNWNEKIVFETNFPEYYQFMVSKKYKVRFGILKSWLRELSRERRLTQEFYEVAKAKADELYINDLQTKCYRERASRRNYRPHCEKLNELRN